MAGLFENSASDKATQVGPDPKYTDFSVNCWSAEADQKQTSQFSLVMAVDTGENDQTQSSVDWLTYNQPF